MNLTSITNSRTVGVFQASNPPSFALDKTAEGSGTSFSATLKLQLAETQAQAFNTLLTWPSDERQGGDTGKFESVFDNNRAVSNPLDLLQNLSSSGVSLPGRNTALFDPESAYRMMTTINRKDVSYKAEFSEMNAMKSELAVMQEEGIKLGQIDGTTNNEAIIAQVQEFADAYNRWIDRFDQELEPGGILAGTRAAQVSQWELEQSIENIFHGAHDGVRGLPALGLTTDPLSNRAELDVGRLSEILTSNKSGVIGTLKEFGANFARSAELLISEDNFVDSRLDNLSRAINFIDSNKAALQTEFGRGDEFKPSGNTALALASYLANAKV